MRSGGVPEALGRGLGPILAPKGAPWTKMMPKGRWGFPPRGPSWRPKFTLFRHFGTYFCTYFQRGVWEGFRDRFWIDFGWFFDDLFDDLLDLFSCSPHKWKCHSDSLFTMYEAHGRYRKWAKNVIKSYTFQGCFPEGLREWILAPFFIDFGLILEGLGAPKVAKQPSES